MVAGSSIEAAGFISGIGVGGGVSNRGCVIARTGNGSYTITMQRAMSILDGVVVCGLLDTVQGNPADRTWGFFAVRFAAGNT